MMMLSLRMTFDEARDIQLKFNPYFETQWNRIIEEKYLEKKLNV